MYDRDWRLTDATLAGLQFSEWLIVNQGSPNNFTDAYARDVDAAWASAEAQGWVETIQPDIGRPRRLGDRIPQPRPKLTGRGRQHIDQVKRLRLNAVARAAACRQAILLWLYNSGRGTAGTDQFIPAGDYEFYGTPFTEDEVSDAVKYLSDRGFIQGIKTWGPVIARPVLTNQGIECVEHNGGDVRAFLTPPQSNAVIYNQNFNAAFSGQAAQGQVVHQVEHQGIDPAAAAQIFTAMRQALSDVTDPDDRDDAEHAIRELEAAVEDYDANEVDTRAGRLKRLAIRIGSRALTAATTTGTMEPIQMFERG